MLLLPSSIVNYKSDCSADCNRQVFPITFSFASPFLRQIIFLPLDMIKELVIDSECDPFLTYWCLFLFDSFI